jgi:hypothetical protein
LHHYLQHHQLAVLNRYHLNNRVNLLLKHHLTTSNIIN